MSEQLGHENASVPPQVQEDVLVLVKRIQQQLVFLEKKIDTLISQSQERPAQRQHFSKPYRSFGHSPHHGQGGHRDHRERDFDKGSPFEKRPGEGRGGFSHKKREYDNPRESHADRGRPFQKHESGEHRGFARKKKPFFQRHRDRD